MLIYKILNQRGIRHTFDLYRVVFCDKCTMFSTSTALILLKRGNCRHIWLLTEGSANIHVPHTPTHARTLKMFLSYYISLICQKAPSAIHWGFLLYLPSQQLISLSLQLLLLHRPPSVPHFPSSLILPIFSFTPHHEAPSYFLIFFSLKKKNSSEVKLQSQIFKKEKWFDWWYDFRSDPCYHKYTVRFYQ